MRKTLKAFAIASAIALSLPAAGTARAVSAETSSSQIDGAVCFVLREEDGKIALYKEGSPEPLAVYDAPPLGLCPADSELLREGIRLKTRAEVTRLIEDLGAE